MKARLLIPWAFLLASCRAPERRWPFPAVEGASDEAVLSTLSHRTNGVRSLYAVLSMSFETRERSAVAQAVVHYKVPGFIRMTAFKDMLFSSESLFDLVLTPERFSMLLRGENGLERQEGQAADLARIHPGFRSFQMLREAMFLPGLLSEAGRKVVTCQGGQIFVHSVTPSGHPVEWALEERTLGVKRARVAVPDSSDLITIDYESYRKVQGVFLPEAFTLADPGAGVRVIGILEEVELNPELEGGVFKIEGG